MVNAFKTPGTSVYDWSSGRSRNAPQTTSTPRAEALSPKYCSACSSCQRARIKCSGGSPCRRCISQSVECTYKLSRRSGRLRTRGQAETFQEGQAPRDPQSLSIANRMSPREVEEAPASQNVGNVRDWPAGDVRVDDNIQPNALSMPTPADNSENLFDNTQFSASLDLDSLLSFQPNTSVAIPHSFAQTLGPIQASSQEDIPVCGSACSCDYDYVHQSLSIALDRATKSIEKTCRFDKVLQLIRDTSDHTAKYLACSECGTSCRRMMNTTILFQALVNLLCKICKDPNAYFAASDTLKLGVGIFQLSDAQDICHKCLLLISAAKLVERSVSTFDTLICSQYGIENTGVSNDKLTESSRLNLNWLLGSTRNMGKRLRTIIGIMERPEWGPQDKT